MPGPLDLYTDASVVGRWLAGWGERSRNGPGFVAWAGWHGCTLPDRPTFAGQAFVGRQGTQTAEYHAVLQGLAASLTYVQTSRVDARPEGVRIHVDNAPVYRLIVEDHLPNVLRPHFETMKTLTAALRRLGVEVVAENVSEDHPAHKVAHRMSKQARNQVLIEPGWRPVDDKPPKKKTKPPDNDIPF